MFRTYMQLAHYKCHYYAAAATAAGGGSIVMVWCRHSSSRQWQFYSKPTSWKHQ